MRRRPEESRSYSGRYRTRYGGAVDSDAVANTRGDCGGQAGSVTDRQEAGVFVPEQGVNRGSFFAFPEAFARMSGAGEPASAGACDGGGGNTGFALGIADDHHIGRGFEFVIFAAAMDGRFGNPFAFGVNAAANAGHESQAPFARGCAMPWSGVRSRRMFSGDVRARECSLREGPGSRTGGARVVGRVLRPGQADRRSGCAVSGREEITFPPAFESRGSVVCLSGRRGKDRSRRRPRRACGLHRFA